MSYDGEYDASEYPDGINAPRLGWRGSREMAELRAAKDAEIEQLRAQLTGNQGLGAKASDEQLVSTTHHTFLVGPWAEEGVHVVQADDPDMPVLLLRDRGEVLRLVTALLEAVAESK